VLALAVLMGGCGLSANSKPRVIAADDLPTELLDPSPSSSTTLGQSPTTTSVTVYFLTQQDGVVHLVGAPREVKDSSRPRDHLAALLVPPTPVEQAHGLLTSIPADTVLIDTKLDESTGELTIDLSRSLFDIQGQELRNAFAQLVWTATDVAGVRAVRFLVAGKEYRVPDENGIEQPGAVTRANYGTLGPVPVTTTVPAPTVPTTVAPPPP
jgi:spore germination protein GerM